MIVAFQIRPIRRYTKYHNILYSTLLHYTVLYYTTY
jgi:hypothetical protein